MHLSKVAALVPYRWRSKPGVGVFRAGRFPLSKVGRTRGLGPELERRHWAIEDRNVIPGLARP